jgi:hypothetical protein
MSRRQSTDILALRFGGTLPQKFRRINSGWPAENKEQDEDDDGFGQDSAGSESDDGRRQVPSKLLSYLVSHGSK